MRQRWQSQKVTFVNTQQLTAPVCSWVWLVQDGAVGLLSADETVPGVPRETLSCPHRAQPALACFPWLRWEHGRISMNLGGK